MKTSQPDPAKSVRTLRVGEQVRHALAAALTRGVVKDDVLDRHIISVTEVRLTPDLRIATAYVMPLGGADTAAIIKALAEHAPRLRAEVAKAVRLKYAPDLRFRPDESFAEGQRIDELLRRPEVARDLGE